MSRPEEGMNKSMRWVLALCIVAIAVTTGWIFARRPQAFDTSALVALKPTHRVVDRWSETLVFPASKRASVLAQLRAQCKGNGWTELPYSPSPGTVAVPSPAGPPVRSSTVVAAKGTTITTSAGRKVTISRAATAMPIPVSVTTFIRSGIGRVNYVEVTEDPTAKTLTVAVNY